MEDKLLQVASNFFGEKITIDAKLGDIEKWDSLGHINFFMAIEEAFDIKVSPDEIIKTTSIKDILDLLKSK